MIANEESKIETKPIASASLISRALGTLWEARGFFGGLIALGLAMYGQQALILNHDEETSTRYYLVAIIMLIASWLRPTWKRQGKQNALDHNKLDDKETVPSIESNPVLESNPSTETVPSSIEPDPVIEAVPSTEIGSITKHSFVPYEPGIDLYEKPRPANSGLANTMPRQRLSWKSLRAWIGAGATKYWVALTLLLTAVSAAMLTRDINDPIGGWLWAATLLALLITSLRAKDPNQEDTLLPVPRDDFSNRGRPNISVRWEIVLMVIILCVALALRLYNLEYHPLIFGDEGERGMEGRAINEGVFHPLFGFGWWSVPNLYFYCVAWLLRIFGDTMVGDRMICVISGMIMVWFIYRTARLLWGPRAGLLAGAMLAVSPLALQFSRSASESTPTAALWTVGFYFLFMALRYRRWSDWVLAGLGWGFSLYFYASSKLIIPLAVVVALYCLVRWRKQFIRHYAAGFVVTAFALGLAFMPNAIFSNQENWLNFTARAQQMSITSPTNQHILFSIIQNMPYDEAWSNEPLVQNIRERPLTWAQALIGQARVTLEAIYKRHDGAEYYRNDLYHNGTMMQPLLAVLTLLGLAYAIWKLFDARYGLALIWFWGGLLGTILTIDTPTVQRMTGAWSVVMLFPALVADRIFADAWPLKLGLARRWATVPLVALLIYFAADSYQEYFVVYPSFYPKFWNTYAQYSKSLGQEYKVYQLPHESGGRFDYGVVRFVAKGVEGTTVYEPVEYLPITDNNDKGVAFVVLPPSAHYMPILRSFYPGGIEEAIKDTTTGTPQFTSYKLTREQMAQFHQLHVTYTPQYGQPIRRNEPNLGTIVGAGHAPPLQWAPPPEITYPAKVTWEGGLVAPKYGVYTLQVSGGQDARLELDGKVVVDMSGASMNTRQVDIVMSRGIHNVNFNGTLSNPKSPLEVKWATPGQPPNPIPANYLFSGSTGGLSGEAVSKARSELLTAQDPFEGLPIRDRRSYPIVGFRDLGQPFSAEPPAILRWQGTIQITTAGSYGFDLVSNGAAVLMIDGRIVTNPTGATGATSTASGNVNLSAGEHDVDIRYDWEGGGALIEWFWTPPGAPHILVPPDVLLPRARSWSTSEVTDAPPAQLQP